MVRLHHAELASATDSRSTGPMLVVYLRPALSNWTLVAAALLIAGVGPSLQAQDAAGKKPSPARIESQMVLLPEAVVLEQWAHTLKLVNAPNNVALLNPGQCVRVGIYSTGDNRDEYLARTRLSFVVHFAGHSDAFPLSSPSEFKQIKPDGLDRATAALSAAGVKMPDTMKTMASLAASAEHWCAPSDAGDGTATVEAEVTSPGGRQILNSSVAIESFETGSKRTFRDPAEFESFLQTYYRQPNPARLLPAMQFMISAQTQDSGNGQAEIVSAFLSAAIKSDPVAAQDFRKRVASQSPLSRALGLLILRSAGCDISAELDAMSKDERDKFLSLVPLGDPFDLAPTQALFQHLDMLWAVFGATRQFKPVKTVASALSWKSDYEDFDKLRKTPNHPSTLTPAIVRGVTYTAAGWSLYSFQRNDPLVADYIEYLLASPETPELVKSGLRTLSTNPAFKRAGGQ